MLNAAGAVANAIANATGVSLERLPLTWSGLHRGLKSKA
jgi:CO/xanthine dehydrogenase Mo-binding subunit